MIIGTIIIMFFMITVPVFIGYESYYVSQQKDFLQSANSQITKNVDSLDAITMQLMILENREAINTILLNQNEEIIEQINRKMQITKSRRFSQKRLFFCSVTAFRLF